MGAAASPREPDFDRSQARKRKTAGRERRAAGRARIIPLPLPRRGRHLARHRARCARESGLLGDFAALGGGIQHGLLDRLGLVAGLALGLGEIEALFVLRRAARQAPASAAPAGHEGQHAVAGSSAVLRRRRPARCGVGLDASYARGARSSVSSATHLIRWHPHLDQVCHGFRLHPRPAARTQGLQGLQRGHDARARRPRPRGSTRSSRAISCWDAGHRSRPRACR